MCCSCGKYGHLRNLCPSSLTDWKSHDDGENPTSLMNNETVRMKMGEVLEMTGEVFGL